MRRLHLAACAFAVSTSACVASSTAEPEFGNELGQSRGPTYDEYDAKSQPTYAGPPGGGIDREWQYGTPAENSVPTADQDAINAESGGYYGAYDPYASADLAVEAPVADPAQVTANVTDGEIDQTLQPYGEWIETAEYGLVWRPYTTVVGANFTPYETCGEWVWTDFGWTFSCEWTWGWLPFHYGSWVTVGDTWCWSRGYEWGPAWVDWRYGRDYIGWRPRHPRGRPSHVGHWSWGHTDDFGGNRPVRPRRINDAIGVRSTIGVKVPPVRGNRPVRVAHVMGGRGVVGNAVRSPGSYGRPGNNPTPTQPGVEGSGPRPDRQTWNRPRHVQPPPRDLRPGSDAQGPGSDRPTINSRPTDNPRPTYQNPPTNVAPYRPAPSRPSYSPPSRPSRSDYTPPSRPSSNDSPPSRPSSSPPSRPSSAQPSRPSSTQPSRPSSSYSPPSRPSPSSSRPSSPSRPSGSFTPSRSSGSSGGGGRRR